MIRRTGGLGQGGLGGGQFVPVQGNAGLLRGAPQPAAPASDPQKSEQQSGLGGIGAAVKVLSQTDPKTGRSMGGNALSWGRRQAGLEDPYATPQQQQQRQGGGSPPGMPPREPLGPRQPSTPSQPSTPGQPSGPEPTPTPSIEPPPPAQVTPPIEPVAPPPITPPVDPVTPAAGAAPAGQVGGLGGTGTGSISGSVGSISTASPASISMAAPTAAAVEAPVAGLGTAAGTTAGTAAASTVAPVAVEAGLAAGAGAAGTAAATAAGAVGAEAAAGAAAAAIAEIAPFFLLGFSDRRDKTDIQKLGRDPDSGEQLYAYRYKGDPKSYPKVVGPMAQDIERDEPGRVHEVGGHKVVAGLAEGGRVPSGYRPTSAPLSDTRPPDPSYGSGKLWEQYLSPHTMGIHRDPPAGFPSDMDGLRHPRPGERPVRAMAEGGEVAPFDQTAWNNNMAAMDYADRLKREQDEKRRPPMWQRALNLIQGYDADAQLGGFARGGRTGSIGSGASIPHFQAGGAGLVPGTGAGRADTVRTAARRGSYVLPADVVSGAGEGNTMAGAAAITRRLGSPAGQGDGFARGGVPGHDAMEVAFSGGEYVIAPERVAELGEGDPQRGSERLDAFVRAVRQAARRAVDAMPEPR